MSCGKDLILVVEDDEAVRRLICALLAQSGFETLEAGDGREALALWDARAEEIRLLLTDVVMPHMDGRELALRVRSDRPDIQVVFMSGYSDDPVLAELGYERTFFLSKPFTPTALTSKIREVLGTRQASGVQ
jgi:two-component system, cell cycle sensor histidine kinase and response regulator CckA